MKRLLFLLLAAQLHAETQITWQRQQLHGDFYSEGAAIGDINGDGKPDVVAGPFWWEGPTFEKKHAYYEPKIFSINGYSDNFFAYVQDFNADQKNDILILGFPGKEARMYLNPGTHDDKPWPMHIVADVVDNESPVFTDITGDGKPEIVCSTAGWLGWFEPDWENPTKKWMFTGCHPGTLGFGKFTHGLGVGDVNGDGRMDLLEARHWWEQPENPTGYDVPFTGGYMSVGFVQHSFAAGIGGGAQMFAYDFDGNGTNDVFTSLNAHRYGVAVFLQNKGEGSGGAPARTENKGSEAATNEADKRAELARQAEPISTPHKGPHWTRVLLASEQPQDNDYGIVFSQPHAAHLADIDGDGIKDIVTGKRYWAHNGHDPDERGARVIYWYQTKRDGMGGVDFVPHLVDAASGVGVDVQVGDVNGDKLPDIVVGNKAGVFILTQERKDTTADLTPKKMYGPALMAQKDYAHGTRVSGERLRPAGSLSRPAEDRPQADANTPASESRKPASGGTPDAARETRALPHALDLMQLPGGFKAELIAAEPDIVQPIAFTFDERGRIWVVEGNSYPKPRAVGAGQDRIKILEDKDGDGSFETIQVFAEGLNLVSGIELGFGGVWVGAAPYLMFIPREGDKPLPLGGKRAIPRPMNGTGNAGPEGARNGPATQVPGLNFTAYALLDGWGSQDTHETLNSFIWGPDGWLYGCHGVFTHSKVGKPGAPEDQRKPINSGVWRYHPTRLEFEIFAEGTSNPWGLDYDQYGEFFVTACVIPHLYHIVPGGRYQRQAGQHFNPYTYDDIKTIADHLHYAGSARPDVTFDKATGAGIMNNDTNALGGGHAHCGLAIYQSSLFPPTYRNQLIFGNLHGHRLVTDYTDPHGSTYIGKHGSDFMRANDMHFIPVTQKVGPDGALYVSDWSDQQICHRGSNAVENWDRTNGRIYRISYGEERLRPAGSLSRLAEDRSVTADSSPASESRKPASGGMPDATRETHALQFPPAPFDLANESDEALALLAVQTENEWFSRMARRVLMERVSSAFHQLSNAAALSLFDVDPKDDTSVPSRLRKLWAKHACMGRSMQAYAYGSSHEALRTWSVRLGHPYQDIAMRQSLAVVDKSPLVRRELASSLSHLRPATAIALATALLKHGEDKDDPMIPLLIWYGIEPLVGADPKVGLELARVSKLPKVTEFIYRRLAAEGAGRVGLLRLAAQTTDARQRDVLVKTVLNAGLAGNAITQPENWDLLRTRLVETPPSEDPYPRQQTLAELEGLMGIPAALDELRALLTADKASARGNALKILMLRKDAKTAGRLQEMLGWKPMLSAGAQRESLQALAVLKDARMPEVVAKLLKGFAIDVLPDAINTLASTREGAKELLRAVETKTVPTTALSPFLVRQLTAFDDAEINALIQSAWGDVNAPKADLAERMKKYRALLTPAALAKGDLAKGKLLFTMTCGQCHKLFGEGQSVGPDITGSNRADLNYLLENVLDPNAVIGKAYQLNLFTMKDGRVMSGVIKDESPAAVRIAMMGGVEFTLPKPDIAKREVSKYSTMPEGLFDALKPEMVIDLVKYLQSGATASAKARHESPNTRALASAATVPGALEGEALQVISKTGGNARPQGMGGFGSAWSGASQLWWTGAKPGQKLTLALPVPATGKYVLKAALTLARDYGIIDVSLDDKPVATAWDGFHSPKVIHSDELDWGTHELSAGEHQLTITLTGKHPAALPRYMVGLDYVRLEKK